MDASSITIIVFLTLVGFGCGIAIFMANRFLPEEDKMLKRTFERALWRIKGWEMRGR